MIDDLRSVVRAYETSRPRSRQRDLGASEIGNPCSRRLAYRLLGASPANTDSDPWAAIVGTSVHAWLDRAFTEENRSLGWDRWQTEVRVETPFFRGTADLLDRHTRTVIDHKVLGATSLKALKKDGPSEQYRTQVHLYAAGLRLAGEDVDHVGIAAWSRSGWLKDAHWWGEPYDEERVESALARLDALKTTTDALGRACLPVIPTTDANCTWCPFYVPAVTDPTEGCPGHAEAPAAQPAA